MASSGLRYSPWIRWYVDQASKPGEFKDLDRKVLSYYDNVAKSYLSDPSRFVTEVATSGGTNFVVVAASGNNVKILHQCFSFSAVPGGELEVYGIWGSRSSSPFKKINIRAAVHPLSVSSVTTRGGKAASAKADPTIPSIEQFLGVDNTSDFASLMGGAEDTPVAALEKEPSSFWLHPFIYRSIKGTAGGRAAELGLDLISALREVDADEKSKEGASEGHRALVFLWAVEKGYASQVTLGDLPDLQALDEKCQGILDKLRPGSPTGSGSPAGGGDGSAGAGSGAGTEGGVDLNKALMRNLTALTEQTLKTTEREEKKKSMKSLLSPEAEKLFTVLCATDWRDKEPETSEFLDKLLADKNMTKALGIIRSASANWKGAVSEKGFAKFLTTGYAAPDIDDRPGGFSVFMFRPLSHRRPRSEKETQSSIRSMFGDGKLSDEMVKYFAKDDFFLPSDLYELEDMVRTCIEGLELLTCEDGIAVEGYRYGLEIIRRQQRNLLGWASQDKLLPVKLAYLFDKTFQNFLSELVEFVEDKNPIQSARRRGLGTFMRDGINIALGGYKYGSLPNLSLPASLVPAATEDTEDKKLKATGKTSPELGSAPGWWSANPGLVKDWCIPAKKSYGDFFNPRDEKLKPNTSGWPNFPHHKDGKIRPMCVKYQATGKCRAGCALAHIKPDKVAKTQHDEITVRFQAIYIGEGSK